MQNFSSLPTQLEWQQIQFITTLTETFLVQWIIQTGTAVLPIYTKVGQSLHKRKQHQWSINYLGTFPFTELQMEISLGIAWVFIYHTFPLDTTGDWIQSCKNNTTASHGFYLSAEEWNTKRQDNKQQDTGNRFHLPYFSFTFMLFIMCLDFWSQKPLKWFMIVLKLSHSPNPNLHWISQATVTGTIFSTG